MTINIDGLAFQHGKPTSHAKFKACNEDFVVKEVLGYALAGEGEHLMLRIRKNGENTSFVANELARVCGVKSKDIGWAGLKDRHAVTEQWLSIHLPKKNVPDFTEFLSTYPSIEIVDTTWHNKKLRPGDLAGNDFEIRLTDVSDIEAAQARVAAIINNGVPNYFGPQRFGHEGNNVAEARRWGRENVRTRNQSKRSMYLSAARSWIFNHIVSDRIEQQCYDQVLVGDVVRVDGQPVLVTEVNHDDAIVRRSAITAALAGDNALPTQGDALALEQRHLDNEADLMLLIRGNRMRHDRRNITLMPEHLKMDVEENALRLSFFLDSGSFATSILREIAVLEEIERQF
ncbi:tRNA pseudouridine(13) synthase TruD [Vibrio sp. 10N.286.49.C2]|uniref:tRNA pseudouridine(13) synthase TruD n=1 Tax=unclassified Vibrio TaxID=2614977 RepID=UPI000C817A39|nr:MULTISPECIES: tRNA pseudouridine(13) synthase TruD [unclassified Vibrio]PMH29482.1 tRNA pseudouridine(13) synthase TruD [Vibrio sp. 10N.286.49.C2]PMH55997.1 tRNA pseudouridine(13) synthase TruD [Vibrio sp. 10N.286.49.B1]PMH77747.1 tRNA pseudouridine(13) synthase TruD [Vibrio sp. 10N.286.48.B7]